MKKSVVLIWVLVSILFIMSSSFTIYGLYLNFREPAKPELLVQSVSVSYTENGGGSIGNPIYSNSSITFSSSLLNPGSSVTYKVTFSNDSNKDIILTDFEKSTPESSDINFELVGVTKGNIISKNSTFDMLVKISYDSESKGNTKINTNLTVKVDYEEK